MISTTCPAPSVQDPRSDAMQQDAEFWFVDGTIVLIAQRTAFRVHQGVLARHSDVFRDLFAIPQPPAGEGEPMLGCPVVRVQDAAADVRYLLHALYDGRRYYVTSERKYPFAEVAAIVRLAHKYQIEELEEQGLAVLKTVFTDNWDVWTALNMQQDAPPCSTVLSTTMLDAIAAVNIARLVDAPRMLPVALYLCSLLKDLFKLGAGQEPTGLSPDDLGRCLNGTVSLATSASMELARVLLKRSPECESLRHCSILGQETFIRFSEHRTPTLHVTALSELPLRAVLLRDMCDKCKDYATSSHLAYRRRTWERLPLFFGLEPWDKLGVP